MNAAAETGKGASYETRALPFGCMELMLAAMALFTAKPASAQVAQANCYPAISISSWPYGGYTQWCGSATFSDGANMAGALHTILLNDQPSVGTPADQAGNILSTYNTGYYLPAGARFWIFGTLSEFYTYCKANPTKFGFGPGKPVLLFLIQMTRVALMYVTASPDIQ